MKRVILSLCITLILTVLVACSNPVAEARSSLNDIAEGMSEFSSTLNGHGGASSNDDIEEAIKDIVPKGYQSDITFSPFVFVEKDGSITVSISALVIDGTNDDIMVVLQSISKDLMQNVLSEFNMGTIGYIVTDSTNAIIGTFVYTIETGDLNLSNK